MKSLHGNTQGLKSNQLRRIEKLYQRRIHPHQIVTPEFARQISELSHEIHRQIGALIDRKGYVEFMIVGDARRIELPDFKRVRVAGDRFRGLRCVHTHLRGEELTRDDLTDLALLRLDLMAAIEVDEGTGLPGLIHSAHLLPSIAPESGMNGNSRHFAFLAPALASQLDVDFLGLIEALEGEMARTRRTSRSAAGADRAILVNVSTGPLADAEDSIAELRELAQSAGVVVLDEMIQRRPAIDPRTVLGKGKLDELLISAMQLGADAIIFDRELQAAQVRSISEATDLKVIDRSQLILDIFAQRAQSHEGKIQVELAQLKYILPRLVMGQNSAFSRLAGVSGGGARVKRNWKQIDGAFATASIVWKLNWRRNENGVSSGGRNGFDSKSQLFPLSAIRTPANQRCLTRSRPATCSLKRECSRRWIPPPGDCVYRANRK